MVKVKVKFSVGVNQTHKKITSEWIWCYWLMFIPPSQNNRYCIHYKSISNVIDVTKSQHPVGFVHGSASWNMRKQYEDLVNKNFRDGRRADVVFRATMESIFDKLQSRLNDENLIDVECIYNTEDITSLETVMAGNMSTSDYSALFLVHQCMVKKGKHLVYDRETTKQRIENRKHSRHLSGFIHRLLGWIYLWKCFKVINYLDNLHQICYLSQNIYYES